MLVNNGGTFALTVTTNTAAQTATFAFPTELLLAVTVALAPVQADLQDAPSYFLNNTFSASFTNNASLLPLPNEVKVVAGAMTLAHNRATVSVGTDVCLLPVRDPPQDADPVLEVTSGDCR